MTGLLLAHGYIVIIVGAALDNFGLPAPGYVVLFAGMSRMKCYRFVPYYLAAVTVWAIVYTLVGHVFGEYWDALLSIAKTFGYGIAALVILALVLYGLRRRAKRKKRSENY